LLLVVGVAVVLLQPILLQWVVVAALAVLSMV
jgi:hypothetical protein